MMHPASDACISELLKLGQLGLELGYRQQAESYFEQVLAQIPDHPQALLGKARCCTDRGQALDFVQRALAVQPDCQEAAQLQKELQQALADEQRHARLVASSRIYQTMGPRAAVLEEDLPSTPPHAPSSLGKSAPPEPPLASAPSGSPHDPKQRVMMSVIILNTILGLVLMGLIIALVPRLSTDRGMTQINSQPLSEVNRLTSQTPQSAPDPNAWLYEVESSIVQLVVPDLLSGQVLRGSGVVVAEEGLVLTNNHVMANSIQLAAASETLAFVGFAKNAQSPPTDWYIGALVASDVLRDLAVLRVFFRADGGSLGSRRFRAIRVGDSGALALGQPLVGLGYPTLGGNTITLTRGSMAGFVTDQNRVSLGKTDTQLLPGSSGGAVLDSEGALVGVITGVFADQQTQGRLSYFVLIAEANHVIEQARYAPNPQVPVSWMVDLYRQTLR